jgi:creatinine amidohydrolase
VGLAPVTELESLRWPDLATAEPPLLLVPLGSTEQHGPHLPLGTDTAIAGAICRGLAARLASALVAPALPYGSSGEHAGFPGTLSIGQEALELTVVELVRSADSFAGVVLVSGHGGNAEPLARACLTLEREGRRVLAWWPTAAMAGRPGDLHAGRSETSMMLALRPLDVRTEQASAGPESALEELIDLMRARGVRAVSDSGVLGDPSGASAAEGAKLLDTLVEDLFCRVEAWRARQ